MRCGFVLVLLTGGDVAFVPVSRGSSARNQPRKKEVAVRTIVHFNAFLLNLVACQVPLFARFTQPAFVTIGTGNSGVPWTSRASEIFLLGRKCS